MHTNATEILPEARLKESAKRCGQRTSPAAQGCERCLGRGGHARYTPARLLGLRPFLVLAFGTRHAVRACGTFALDRWHRRRPHDPFGDLIRLTLVDVAGLTYRQFRLNRSRAKQA